MTEREHRQRRHALADEKAEAVVQEIAAREPRVHRARARYELASRLFKAFVAAGLAAAIGLLIYLAGSANAGAEAIQDCTTPGGKCYERSQAQSAMLVGQIVKAQQDATVKGSAPSRENLTLTKANAQNITLILAILDEQYPEAAAAVRAELGVKRNG
jgi:hypothetical protein